jgi:hypothetical protein
MARGLSDLQKKILIMAYSRKLKAEAEGTYLTHGYGCDLLAAHVLEGYYGWKKAGIYKLHSQRGS